MAGAKERTLRRRIRSVESTKKITRAMELIAASQMVRAQNRIAAARPYTEAISAVLRATASDSSGATRLIGQPESPRTLCIVAIVGDRGLCGGYNSAVLRRVERLVRGRPAGTELRLVTVGRKAVGFFRFRGVAIAEQFSQMSDRPSYDDARRLAAAVVPQFMAEEVDLVQVVSTSFRSASSQVVEVRQLLPLPPEAHEDRAGFAEFEPDAEELLELLVPTYAEAALYAALLEASAAEHTARQRAMSAATENAEELSKRLRRVMNRARQDAITSEIMEIVGGAEALRRGSTEHSFDIEEQSA